MKNFRFLFMACLTIALSGLFVSCQSDAKGDARADVTPGAKTDVTANVTPVNNAAKGAKVVPTGPSTSMKFDESVYEYGTVDQGEKVEHIYEFVNSGDEPLIISNAKGSCGCTVPSWPKEPIAPGDKGEILVQFDTKGKKGNQTKTVTITANTTPPQTTLRITGVVNAPEAPAKPIQ